METNQRAILINCPSTGKPILTGLAANKATFVDTMIQRHQTLCPHCGATHVWSKKDAHLAGTKR
jgi:hypothetical protein